MPSAADAGGSRSEHGDGHFIRGPDLHLHRYAPVDWILPNGPDTEAVRVPAERAMITVRRPTIGFHRAVEMQEMQK